MRAHILTVDEDREGFTITCAEPATCGGWIECTGDHSGYDPENEESPAFDEWEDVEIHGVLHDWRHGHGWTVPYPGCVVASESGEAPDELHERVDGEWLLKPGRWLVDDDWDDTDCYLTVVGPAPVGSVQDDTEETRTCHRDQQRARQQRRAAHRLQEAG